MNKHKWKLAATIAVPVVGGTIAGTLATRSAKSKYRKLNLPKLSPPSWVFPVAWTGLYTTMGIAKYQFDEQVKTNTLQTKGNIIYSIQLGLNFLWSFLFFRWNLRGTAFLEIAFLLTAITLNTYYFYQKSKISGSLMIPYLSWVTYAMGLNYATWKMNDDTK